LRVAALYDIHGNLPALKAVLRDLPADSDIVIGGDIVTGPFPSETLECLQALGDRVRWIRGNADRELTPGEESGNAPTEVVDWVRSRLDEKQMEFLHELPPTLRLDVDGLGRVLFCHATPRNDVDVFTEITPAERVAEHVAGADADVVVCGHTHMQFDRRIGALRVVNAGSVGWPYEDADGAYWALLGPDVEHRRTVYERDLGDFIEDWPKTSRREATELFERLYVSERVAVGRVGKTHGRSGAFVVEQASVEPERFAVGAELIVGGQPARVEESKRAGGRTVIRLNRRVARGATLEVPRSALEPTEENEYYAADLIGLTVVEDGGRELGHITAVEPYEANDVLELDTGVLLPMVEDCIRDVDLQHGRILIAPGFANPG
jgi:16S rRNA processing protein RimM